MARHSADKVKFTSFDDLFGSAPAENNSDNQIVRLPLDVLHPFKEHPFRVVDDDKMMETVASVKQYGVLVPGIVRKDRGGEYEIVAGHRRKRASELAGCQDMPVIVRKLMMKRLSLWWIQTSRGRIFYRLKKQKPIV